MLTREQILAKRELRREVVPVPEWGGEVLVQEMTAGDRDRWELDAYNRKKAGQQDQQIRASLAMLCCVAEDGCKLFSQEDVQALSEQSAAALDRIYDAAVRLSGLGGGDLQKN